MEAGNWTQWAISPAVPATLDVPIGEIHVQLPVTREEQRRRSLLRFGQALAREWALVAGNGDNITLTTFIRRAAEDDESEFSAFLMESPELLGRPDVSDRRKATRSERLVRKMTRLVFRSRSAPTSAVASAGSTSSPQLRLVPSLYGAPCAPPIALELVITEGQQAA